MYSVKMEKGNKSWLLPECQGVQATHRSGSGVQLQLLRCRVSANGDGQAPPDPSLVLSFIADGPVVSLPEDADAVYVISCDTGVTMDIHRYPPRDRPSAERR